MTTLRTTTADTAVRITTPKPVFLRMLDFLVRADRGYRENAKLRRLSDAHLRDMGLTRRDTQRGGK